MFIRIRSKYPTSQEANNIIKNNNASLMTGVQFHKDVLKIVYIQVKQWYNKNKYKTNFSRNVMRLFIVLKCIVPPIFSGLDSKKEKLIITI